MTIGLLLISQAALGKQISLLAPLDNFALKESSSAVPPGGPRTYAVTGGTPSWHFVAWDIPGGELPPFREQRIDDTVTLSSRSAVAAIEIIRPPNGRVYYRLSQDGSALPCEEDGKPRESDLFASPNSTTALGVLEVPGLLLPGKDATLPLAKLTSLTTRATVKMSFGAARAPKGCAVSQGNALISVILNNRAAHQTLFYQLDLNMVCGPQPKKRMDFCTDFVRNPRAYYYSRTNPFGVADQLPLVGQSWMANNEERTITVDLLPRLREFVRTAPTGMDRDPDHWALASYYNGQHIWGDVTMSSEWKDLSLVATMRD